MLHEGLDQRRRDEELEELQRSTEQRFGASYNQELREDEAEEERYGEEDSGSTLQNRLPSVKDPKLWLVRCDPQKEEEAVLMLIAKMYKKSKSADRLFIQSAFTTPATKGYVYIEADKEIHVKRAIEGIRILKWWKIALVPIEEMVDAVSIKQQKAAVRKSQWVRMKGGLYRGDLGLVVGLEDQGAKATVKLVPRIDYAQLQKEKYNRENDEKSTLKRKHASARPLPKPFDKDQVTELGNTVSKKNGVGNDPYREFDFFKNQKFKYGFLYRTVPVRSLVLDGPPPALEEKEMFQARVVLGDDGEDEEEVDPMTIDAAQPEKRAANFIKDDRVIVVKGDLKNLTGRVVQVYRGVLTMLPDRKELVEELEFPLDEVRKFFRVGDHVKVINGKYSGETGLIVQIKEKDETVVVFSDVSTREMRLLSADIIESSEVSQGRDSLGSFELHELVQLNTNELVVIVKVEVGSFKVMTSTGAVHSAKVQDIDKKRTSKFASSLDSQNNTLTVDDVVRVGNGPNRGKQGGIKHIFRQNIYIYSRQEQDNSGIYVAQARHCSLMGQAASHSQAAMVAQSPRRSGPMETKGGDRRASGGVQDFRRDPMLQKEVVIRKGPWKGYLGIVQVASDKSFKIALQALNKMISVSRDFVKEKDSAKQEAKGPAAAYGYHAQTPLLGSQTPAWSRDGGMTPARADGGMTPARDAFSAGTPSRDVWNPQTPHHNPRTPRTPGNAMDEVLAIPLPLCLLRSPCRFILPAFLTCLMLCSRRFCSCVGPRL
jgi:transcription elongation factor SPT5